MTVVEKMNLPDLQNIRTWVFFYLICFVAILVAATFIVLGITPFFWVSSTLIIMVVGFNFILIYNAIKENTRKMNLMKSITQNDEKE